ncbi:hypothetical protein DXG01_001154, partial [Tephrocybe rancida]
KMKREPKFKRLIDGLTPVNPPTLSETPEPLNLNASLAQLQVRSALPLSRRERLNGDAFRELLATISKKFTVITQFISSDGTANGDLTEIRRLYIQNGVVIQSTKTIIPSLGSCGSVTGAYCDALETAFKQFQAKGGLTAMGKAAKMEWSSSFTSGTTTRPTGSGSTAPTPRLPAPPLPELLGALALPPPAPPTPPSPTPTSASVRSARPTPAPLVPPLLEPLLVLPPHSPPPPPPLLPLPPLPKSSGVNGTSVSLPRFTYS